MKNRNLTALAVTTCAMILSGVARAATQATTRTAAKVLDVTLEVAEISERPVDAASFGMPAGFTVATSLSEFHGKTSGSGSGGGFDFD